MEHPKEKAHRSCGGPFDCCAGVRRVKSSSSALGWLLVRGESDSWATVRAKRRVWLALRLSCIVCVEEVRGARTPRTLLTVVHRGVNVRVCVDEMFHVLLRRIVLAREGGAQ